MRKYAITIAFILLIGLSVFSQSHVSVPVGDSVYYLLDQAEARGLCAPLPAVKPYTRQRVIEAINEILAAEPKRFGRLSDNERNILETAREEFIKKEPKMDWNEGEYRFDVRGRKGFRFSGDLGISMRSVNSVAYYSDEERVYYGTDTWGTLGFKGDVGEKLSYDFKFSGGLLRAERSELGEYDTYASEFVPSPEDTNYINDRIIVNSEPKAFFPYTYQKGWDGFLFGPGNISASGMESWPQKIAIGPSMLGEITASAFDEILLFRFARIQREWGGMVPGSSLAYNAAARPFTAIETIFNPIPWFSFVSLTGVLEYYNAHGIVESAWTSQSAFSIQQLDINIGKVFHFDMGSSVVWGKRLEFGYIFPLVDNYLYQNFIGDFDNAAIFFNMKARYPGLGNIWFSFFLDEAEVASMIKNAFKQDRHMFAYQVGVQGIIPGVSFASLSISYTKIEPYTYTHTRSNAPWHNSDGGPLESSYTNNGVSLGYYLPPNSDEIKLRFDIHPSLKTSGHWQYQLVRHGADYGPEQVDGSSLFSELDPSGRSSKDSLKKSFLKDGAYQWMHIIKFGAEHTFRKASFLTLMAEIGLTYSYFTTIGEDEYNSYYPPSLDTTRLHPSTAAGSYPTSIGYIFTLGFRIFK